MYEEKPMEQTEECADSIIEKQEPSCENSFSTATEDENSELSKQSSECEDVISKKDSEDNGKIAEWNVVKEFDQIKQVIDNHFQIIKNLLRYTKEKDFNINQLSKTLQQYREGFDSNIFKSIALHIISFREDQKKAYREFQSVNLPLEKIKKYLNYIILDYEDLLSNIGLSNLSGEWLYNNRKICFNEDKTVKIETPESIELSEIQDVEIKSVDSLFNYLKSVEESIVKSLENNSILDKTMTLCIQQNAVYETRIQQTILYPLLRRMVDFYEKTKTLTEDCLNSLNLESNEENALAKYLDLLSEIIQNTETLLNLCYVSIDPYVSDVYDSKKQRILKTICEGEEKEQGTIIKRYTDCYQIDEKVIYPQKVDVYKKNI